MAETIGERLNRLAGRYPVDERLVFGLDVGIASLGNMAANPATWYFLIEPRAHHR